MFQSRMDSFHQGGGDLYSDIEEGHKSDTLCHLANIAYATGRTLHFEPAKERFVDDADQRLTQDYREPYVVLHEV